MKVVLNLEKGLGLNTIEKGVKKRWEKHEYLWPTEVSLKNILIG